jgi:hypothetical protein
VGKSQMHWQSPTHPADNRGPGVSAHAVFPMSLGVVATVTAGSPPADMALSTDGGKLYVVNQGPGGTTNRGKTDILCSGRRRRRRGREMASLPCFRCSLSDR